jgi:hypothetical protein
VLWCYSILQDERKWMAWCQAESENLTYFAKTKSVTLTWICFRAQFNSWWAQEKQAIPGSPLLCSHISLHQQHTETRSGKSYQSSPLLTHKIKICKLQNSCTTGSAYKNPTRVLL